MTMSITPLQKTLVRRSFRKIAGKADHVAIVMYQTLFEINPDCRRLFVGDMPRQGRKFIQMIALTVSGLDAIETVIPFIQELGKRHTGYGVTPEDYESMGQAWLFALEKSLGADFTPPVREAWQVLYQFIAQTAIGATLE